MLLSCRCGIQKCYILHLHMLVLGMDKMVVNHLEKLFVTSDAATILHELEVQSFSCFRIAVDFILYMYIATYVQVQHPAAKMIVMATEMQEQEVCHV